VIAATMVVASAVLVDPRLAAAGALAGWGGPRLREARRCRVRAADVRRELPEVIDLLTLGLAAGGSILAASTAVGRFPFGPVSRGLAEASRLVERGHRLADALERSLASCGDAAVPLVRALVGSDRYGTELRPMLDRLAIEAREERRRAAQADARRVPIRMLMPLVVCVLPAFMLLSVVPALAGTFDGLGLGGR
jgi:tight adherence protein C